MALIMTSGYLLGLVAAAVVVGFAIHRHRGEVPPERLVPVIRAARRRALVAVLFATIVFFAVAIAGLTMPEMLGSPFAVAPLAAGAAGMLLYSLTPPRQVAVGADEPRAAQLVPRSALSALPLPWAVVLLASTGLLVVLVVFCGISADVDEQGLSRTIRFELAGTVASSSPYPGWFYGVPTLLALLALIVCTVVALHRISGTPAFPQIGDAEIDRQWRRGSVEVILKLGVGAVLFAFGGIAVTAGLAMGNAVGNVTRNASGEGAELPVWSVLADALWMLGAAALVLSIVSVTLAALTAVTIGQAAAVRERVR